MTNYQIGDFLIRVKNAALSPQKRIVTVGKTKLVQEVARVLQGLGFLEKIEEKDKNLVVNLAYKNKKPVLTGIKLVSRPGLRIYMGVSDLEDKKGSSTFIISTAKGILSSSQAKKERIGGEIIAEVW